MDHESGPFKAVGYMIIPYSLAQRYYDATFERQPFTAEEIRWFEEVRERLGIKIKVTQPVQRNERESIKRST